MRYLTSAVSAAALVVCFIGLANAAPLDVWHPRTPDTSTTATFFDAAYGPSGFLIGGQYTLQISLTVMYGLKQLGKHRHDSGPCTGTGSSFAAGYATVIL